MFVLKKRHQKRSEQKKHTHNHLSAYYEKNKKGQQLKYAYYT